MKRLARTLSTLLLVTSLLAFLPTGRIIYAAGVPVQPAFSGQVVLDGPLQLTLTLTPPVTSPGSTLNIDLLLLNQENRAASPEVVLTLPTNLSLNATRLPAGVTFNYQNNSLSWLPILSSAGETRQLTLPVQVSAADLTRPETHLTVSLRNGEQVQNATLPLWIGLPPTVSARAVPAVAAVGQPIQLIADTQGPGPFSQNWDLGDGRRVTAPNPTVVFATAGTYQVTVQLANPLAEATAVTTVTIVPRPAASFSVDDEKPVPLQPVQFTNQSGGEQPLTFLWEFGDGTTSSERDPVHAFPTTGYFPVRLIVQSPAGQAETTLTLVVGNPPVADFEMETQTSTGLLTPFRAYFDDTVNELRWDMGDGTTYSGETGSHVFSNTGVFNVTLTAANEYGEVTVTRPVSVTAGSFTTYLPQIYAAGPPAVADLSTFMTPRQPVMPFPGAIAGEPGGAGPTPEDLPFTVMPQVDVQIQPPTNTLPADPANPALPAAPDPNLTFEPTILPEQSPLPPEATPAESLLWYINEARRLHNLPPLEYDYELSIAAQMHTEDILAVPGLMHLGSDGSTPEIRQARYGFNGYYAGEAVAWGWQSPVPVVEFWVNSAAHRVLLLNPNATHVGVGYAADGTAPNIWYWTAEFGLKLENNPLPLPN